MAETLPAPLVDLADLGARAADFARASRSVATLRVYRSDWADFSAWCTIVNLERLPADPTTVGWYLTARVDTLSVATLGRRVATIAVAHKLAGHRLDTRHPAIADVLSGIRREYGHRRAPKKAISVDELRAMLRKLPATVAGIRDRAILLIGFAGAFRRSELTALDIGDLNITSRGVAITVRRSKTDQQGQGATIGIPRSRKATCPVAALEAWLSRLPIESTYQDDRDQNKNTPIMPVFRPVSRHGHISLLRLSDEALAEVVKNAAKRIGLDPSQYAGHSLRRGFMTAASAAGADLAPIMRQSRHRSVSIAMGYIEQGQIFNNPASKAIGL
jgi:integrase